MHERVWSCYKFCFVQVSSATLKHRLRNNKTMTHLNAIYEYIDSHQNLFVQRLSDAVAIQSVSSQPEHSDDLVTMINHVADQLGTLQFDVQLKDVGNKTFFRRLLRSIHWNISSLWPTNFILFLHLRRNWTTTSHICQVTQL